VESNLRLGPNIHSNADGNEIIMVEKIALEDEAVRAELAKLKLPEGTVVISDPWIYGMCRLVMAEYISDTLKDPTASTRVFSQMISACSNASCMFETPTTLLRRIATIMLCPFPSRPSSVPRL